MELDRNKIEEVAMALLAMTMFEDGQLTRVWKGVEWGILDALHDRGWISDPKSKSKSVVVFPEGKEAAQELIKKYFAVAD